MEACSCAPSYFDTHSFLCPLYLHSQVGVQTMIEPNAGASALEDKVNAAHPISIGVDDEDDNENEK